MLNLFKFCSFIASTSVLGVTSPAIASEEYEGNLQALEPPNPINANIGLVNNYVFRGLSQTNFDSAVQGGIEYAHESGIYIGNWNSTISWITNTYGTGGYIYGKSAPGKPVSAPVELDFYLGIRKDLLAKDFASDIGAIVYYYPTSGIPNTDNYFANPNTAEVYVAQNLLFGSISGNAKLSYALTTFFGTANSRGSMYPELNLNWDTGVEDFSIYGHIGAQYFAGHIQNQNGNNYAIYYSGEQIPNGTSNNYLYSYVDWKVGINKGLGESFILGLAYTGTNSKNLGVNGYPFTSPQGANLGRSQGIISLTKLF